MVKIFSFIENKLNLISALIFSLSFPKISMLNLIMVYIYTNISFLLTCRIELPLYLFHDFIMF
jgi:hypothetical protein